MREDFFFKFKDYNKELEKILEHKDFSKDVKNLLLSMFYKLEISYNDYFLVKRNSKTKQEYLENILDNIKNSNKIELVNPNDKNFEKFKNKGLYEIDLKLKRIKVIANEYALLAALFELNDFQIHLEEKYNLIRNSMPYLLNLAYDMEKIEVLRDFNAWSWNILINEIKDININLVYQNLKIALSFDIFSSMQENNSYTDVIEIIKQELLKTYEPKVVKEFIQLIFKISIIKYIATSENESKRLLDEKQILEQELAEIKDKKRYIENITKEKANLKEKIKEIDLIINNKELLLKEFEKRNNLLSEYNQIFSISHLAEKMQREREKILKKIDVCNKKIEPKNYLEDKNKLQEDCNLLRDIKFDSQNDIYKYIDKLQKIFLKQVFMQKIQNAKDKHEILDSMYELRYYIFLPYTEEKNIRDLAEFKEDIEHLKEIIVKKLYSNKIINTLSSNEKNDIEIVKTIFDLKIINMEYIYIEIKKKGEEYLINIYDEKETLEKSFEMNIAFNKKDKIKLNRKIKLFN